MWGSDDPCHCFIILLIYEDVSLWSCLFFFPPSNEFTVKEEKNYFFITESFLNLFFSLNHLFIYFAFLPNCEIQSEE